MCVGRGGAGVGRLGFILCSGRYFSGEYEEGNLYVVLFCCFFWVFFGFCFKLWIRTRKLKQTTKDVAVGCVLCLCVCCVWVRLASTLNFISCCIFFFVLFFWVLFCSIFFVLQLLLLLYFFGSFFCLFCLHCCWSCRRGGGGKGCACVGRTHRTPRGSVALFESFTRLHNLLAILFHRCFFVLLLLRSKKEREKEKEK